MRKFGPWSGRALASTLKLNSAGPIFAILGL
jgi:hypothetical protein